MLFFTAYGFNECEICKAGVNLIDTIIVNNNNFILDKVNSTCFKIDPPHCSMLVKLVNITMDAIVHTPPEQLCLLECR